MSQKTETKTRKARKKDKIQNARFEEEETVVLSDTITWKNDRACKKMKKETHS